MAFVDFEKAFDIVCLRRSLMGAKMQESYRKCYQVKKMNVKMMMMMMMKLLQFPEEFIGEHRMATSD